MSAAVAEGTHLGPYEVLELVGRGGMGEVYRARDPRLGREVAVKVLPAEVAHDPHRLARFEREARAIAALNHPNILTIHDVGSTDGIAYLVTELVEGQTLRERMLSSPTQSVSRALDLALQVARGLEAAHARGIVHRDVKPENLLVTPDGRVKVLDFGLARQMATAAGGSLETTSAVASGTGGFTGTLSYASPEQARCGPVDARTDVFSLGLVLYELISGRHPFRRDSPAATLEAILEQEAEPLDSAASGVSSAVAQIVHRCLSKDPDGRYPTAHELAVALETVLGSAYAGAPLKSDETRGPYPGLGSFTERDASVFFGREDEAQALWSKLRTRPMLAVIGPSGAGKTSFVRAGVVAGRPEGWGATVARPGRAASTGLARALAPDLAGDASAVESLLRFDDPDEVVETFRRWRRGFGEALLVVDQLEELFTLNPPEEQARYAALLGRLVDEADLHVLLSLRDDFLMRCHEYSALTPVFDSLTPLGPLDRDALRRAVVEPARARGHAFDDEELVEEMVSAVEGERGALPLLAFAMARMWEERDRERKLLTRAAYEALGGVEGALARHAEATLERIGPGRQALVREIFRNLVTAQGTRAVVDRDELLSAFEDESEGEDALGQLVAARLLTSYEPDGPEKSHAQHRIEIVHESLLRTWPRLVRWQAQDEDGAVLRDQLRQAAHLWEQKGRSRDILWTGTAFREFELWRERYPGTLTSLEQEYASAMADRARRHRRTIRLVVAAAFALLAGVAAAIAISREQTVAARDEALAEARRAEASRVLGLAQLRLEDDPTEALALATSSLELADAAESRRFVMRVLWEAPPALELAGVGGGARVPTFSPDGRWLATAGHAPEAHVFDQGGGRIAVLPGHQGTPRGPNWARWGAEGVLVTGLESGLAERLRVWSLPDGRRARTLDLGAASHWEVGEHDLVVETPETASGRSTLRLRSWRLPDGEPRQIGRVDAAALMASASRFSPDAREWLYLQGRTILHRALPLRLGGAAAELSRHVSDVTKLGVPIGPGGPLYSRDAQGELHLYHFDPAGLPRVEVVPRPPNAPTRVYPEPSGRWLVNGPMEENRARVWDRSAWPRSRPIVFRRRAVWYGAVASFHPSGDWLVVSTDNFMNLTFWPLTKRPPSVVDGYGGLARPLAFSPDSRWLATSWADGGVRLWPLASGTDQGERRLALPGNEGPIGIRFDPAGHSLFFGTLTGGAQIVRLDGSRPRSLLGFPSDVALYALAWSPSGRRVAAAFGWGQGDRSLRIWDLQTDVVQTLPLPAEAATQSVRYAEAGASPGLHRSIQNLDFIGETTLLSAGAGGVRRWDLTTGEQEVVFPAPAGHYSKMTLAADGRTAVVRNWSFANATVCLPLELVDLESGRSRELPRFGECTEWDGMALDPTGRVLATSDQRGVVRVGYLTAAEPHLLAGHKGSVSSVAISSDLRWVASAGEDNTLRLWPMPDLDAPPLHTLPRDELIAKLKSLTNLRAVRDSEAPDGWRIDLAPFPGWREVPTW